MDNKEYLPVNTPNDMKIMDGVKLTTYNNESEYLEITDDTDAIIDNNNDNNHNETEYLIQKTTEKVKPVKKREYWMDVLRVFANFLVVLTHSAYGKGLKVGSSNWNNVIMYNSFSRPCVPLFIMISGILFLNPKKEISCKKMFSVYILRIFKSYIFWTIYYNVFEENIYKYIYDRDNFYNYEKTITETINKTIVSKHNHLWYLNFVIGLYMVTPIIKKITPDRDITWYACIIFSIISILLPTLYEIFHDYYHIKEFSIIKNYTDSLIVELSGSYTAYYLLGYLLNKDFTKKIYVYLSIAVGVLGTVLTFILRYGYSLQKGKTDFTFANFNSFTVLMESIGMFVFFKYPIKKLVDGFIDNKPFKTTLMTLSDCSFGIYLLHFSILRLFKTFIPNGTFSSIWWVPTQALLIYFICLVIIFVLRKVSIFKVIT